MFLSNKISIEFDILNWFISLRFSPIHLFKFKYFKLHYLDNLDNSVKFKKKVLKLQFIYQKKQVLTFFFKFYHIVIVDYQITQDRSDKNKINRFKQEVGKAY